MRALTAAALAAFVAGAAVAGCTSSPSPTPRTYDLPTMDGAGKICGDIGLTSAHLTGDPTDPDQVAWVNAGGRRIDVLFPFGYSARFTPKLEILDASGNVVARDGDPVDGGCGAAGGKLLVLWPPSPLTT